MAVIETKYNLGQTVYHSYCSNEAYYEDCPDCDGTGSWKIEGKDTTVGCQMCNERGYTGWNTPGKIKKFKYFPITEKLTIGQIRAHVGYDTSVDYMCEETGISSGRLWREKELTENYELALKCSAILAEKKNAGEDVKVEDLYLKYGVTKIDSV